MSDVYAPPLQGNQISIGNDIHYSFRALIYQEMLMGRRPHLTARTVSGKPHMARIYDLASDALMSEIPYKPESVGRWLFEMGDSLVYLIKTTTDDSVGMYVVSPDAWTAEALTESLSEYVVEPSEGSGDTTVRFWQASQSGGSYNSRALSFPSWPDISRNYPSATRDFYSRLIALDGKKLLESPGHGRLMLFHGPPGTGKTTALRALAREWTSWSSFNVVLDPEKFFNSPAYMAELLLNSSDKWSVILLEDCDELIRGDLRQGGGQAMSRLLNLTDGFLGQARNVLIAITTNEDIGKLHPAVTRPGRCLAQLEFGRFSPAEAEEWLEGKHFSASSATLAELYSMSQSGGPLDNSDFVYAPPVQSGLYL